jgi:hypothetical protein
VRNQITKKKKSKNTKSKKRTEEIFRHTNGINVNDWEESAAAESYQAVLDCAILLAHWGVFADVVVRVAVLAIFPQPRMRQFIQERPS